MSDRQRSMRVVSLQTAHTSGNTEGVITVMQIKKMCGVEPRQGLTKEQVGALPLYAEGPTAEKTARSGNSIEPRKRTGGGWEGRRVLKISHGARPRGTPPDLR